MRTERLLMRRWRPADREPFAALNADPQVMAHFPGPLDRTTSDAFVDRIEAGFDANGFGLWALERLDTGEFIGFTGLAIPSFQAHFTPAVEVGWRLCRSAWGHGFATEAGRQALTAGFSEFGLAEIVSFTATGNAASRAVMRRLGMSRDPAGDFDHPALPPGHRLRRHVFYRLSREAFLAPTDFAPADFAPAGTGARAGTGAPAGTGTPAGSRTPPGTGTPPGTMTVMAVHSRHLGIWIDQPAAEVYDYVRQPVNLAQWAAGLGSSIELIDGQWVAQSPLGPVVVEMAGPNPYGVVDHRVTLASGVSFYNPMRVIGDGDGCELVFTLRRQPGMSDADFDRDADAVAADLRTLKGLLESR